MSYQILIPDNITKLEALPPGERIRILTKIKAQLATQPFPRGQVIISIKRKPFPPEE